MTKFRKKSDWGEYWVTDQEITENKLKWLALELVPRLQIQVGSVPGERVQHSKTIRTNGHPDGDNIR